MEKPPVLLVDDNEATGTLITALLQRDFTIDVATDGLEALKKLRTNTYATVILDLLMPHLSGYGVLDYLRDNNPDMLRRVLVVSAALTRSEMTRLKAYEVCAIISKPFDIEALLAAVKQCAGDPSAARGSMLTSGVILLLADLLRQRLM